MYCKLAFRNVRRSLRDYLIYFITLTFGVCVFYVFNSIGSQEAMLSLTESDKDVLQMLVMMMNYISIFITIVLGFLVLYANRFLIRRRKREMGTYLLLGMNRSGVSLILVLETLMIGIFALAAGLILGFFLSQGLALLTAQIFESTIDFHFVFSMDAFRKTMLYFGIIFLLVMLFNTASIRGYRLINLLKAEAKNETFRVKKLWHAVVLFILSVLCLGSAYYLLIQNGMMEMNREFALCLLLGCAGSLIFFMSLSGFLLRLAQSNKKFYLKGLNMFVLRQLNSKINTTYLSMTIICVMLLVTIGTLSSSIGLSNAMQAMSRSMTPYDMSIAIGTPSALNNTDLATAQIRPIPKETDLLGELASAGVNFSDVSTMEETHMLQTDVMLSTLIQYDDGSLANSFTRLDKATTWPVDAISLSDFNALLAMQGEEPISLEESHFRLCYSFDQMKTPLENFIAHNPTVSINTTALQNEGDPLRQSIETSAGSVSMVLLIVPDAVAAELPIQNIHLNFNFKQLDKAAITSLYDNILTAQHNMTQAGTANPVWDTGYVMMYDRYSVEEGAMGMRILAVYLGLYVGIVFLITSAAILALQQLSEAADNISRYSLLKKIGADDSLITKALFSQIGLYFFIPLALAIVHSVVGIHVANQFISVFAQVDVAQNSLLTAIFLIVVYGGYFLATCLTSRSIILSGRR